MIYFDSCALVKLVREEYGSSALLEWLDTRTSAVLVSSELARAEVLRAVRRSNHTDQGVLVDPLELEMELAEAHDVVNGLSLVAVDREILDAAGNVEAPMLRTLDAVHLASALVWPPDEVEFVTYDRRLAEAAREQGMEVVSPS